MTRVILFSIIVVFSLFSGFTKNAQPAETLYEDFSDSVLASDWYVTGTAIIADEELQIIAGEDFGSFIGAEVGMRRVETNDFINYFSADIR